MKKILAILSIVLCAVSCNKPMGSYSATNVADFLTYKDGTLFNDFGTVFTVESDLTDTKWNGNGNRFYAIFDILDIDYNITLKNYLVGNISDVSGSVQEDSVPTGDPVELAHCTISGGYLNVIYNYYYKEGTDCAHDSKLYYNDDGTDLTLYLVHEGNDENPMKMAAADLKWDSALYCFNIYDLVPSGEYRNVIFDADILYKDTDGNYLTKHMTSPIYTQRLQF